MKSISTNSVKAVVKTKKTPAKSESVILKSTINNNWKQATRSLSGLVRYAKSEGKNDLQKLIDATNKSKGTNVTFGQVANIRNIVAHATERELFKNLSTEKGEFIKGEKKTLFSFWLILQIVGRIAKVQKAELAKVNS